MQQYHQAVLDVLKKFGANARRTESDVLSQAGIEDLDFGYDLINNMSSLGLIEARVYGGEVWIRGQREEESEIVYLYEYCTN